ncbi:hypothetical protein NRIC_33340 [Enterococcus florum]|uniref:Uncharacterized protein n=1 Tax=Enterococcus florum TaxID=2480627 RepID=A0A4P5PRZ7_9ENTE|nr:hypothetical protein NRIC_33340 [Enterococcus florum]
MRIFPLLGALLFSVIALLTFLVTFGLPLGEYTLGGKFKVLPKKMRLISASSFVIQIIAIVIILYAGKIVSIDFSYSLAKKYVSFLLSFLSLIR